MYHTFRDPLPVKVGHLIHVDKVLHQHGTTRPHRLHRLLVINGVAMAGGENLWGLQSKSEDGGRRGKWKRERNGLGSGRRMEGVRVTHRTNLLVCCDAAIKKKCARCCENQTQYNYMEFRLARLQSTWGSWKQEP